MRFGVAVIVAVLLAGGPSLAEEFVRPTYPALAKTMIKFGQIDLRKDEQLDEYALIVHCDIAKRFYENDFEWQRIRQTLRKSLERDATGFPDRFVISGPVNLDRYDFAVRGFRFHDEAPLRAVNKIVLSDLKGRGCLDRPFKFFPTVYQTILAVPINIEAIPMTESEGTALLARMHERGNASRSIYAKMKLKLFSVRLDETRTGYRGTVSFDGALDSIEFYEDKTMSRLLYIHRQ